MNFYLILFFVEEECLELTEDRNNEEDDCASPGKAKQLDLVNLNNLKD